MFERRSADLLDYPGGQSGIVRAVANDFAGWEVAHDTGFQKCSERNHLGLIARSPAGTDFIQTGSVRQQIGKRNRLRKGIRHAHRSEERRVGKECRSRWST